MSGKREGAWVVRRGMAVGLAATGLGLALWGAWGAGWGPLDFQQAKTARSLSIVAGAALVLLVGVRMALAFLQRRRNVRDGRGARDPAGDTVADGFFFWILFLLTTLVAAIWLLVIATIGLKRELDSGFPTAGLVLLVVGSGALVLGVVAGLRRPSRWQTPLLAPGATGRGVIAVTALALAVSLPVASRTANGGVHSSTARPTTVPPFPTAVSRQSWSLRGGLNGVIPAGAGVVVATAGAKGIEALDGRTGRVRWSYRRDRTAVEGLQATPDGRLVAAAFWTNQPRVGDDRQVIVFDAMTGRVKLRLRLSLSSSGPDGLDDSTFRLTPTAIVAKTYGEEEGSDLTAGYSLRTGRRLWSRADPPHSGGRYPDIASTSPVVGDTLLLAGDLDATDNDPGIEAIDPNTGRTLWRFVTQIPETYGAALAPDSSLLAVRSGDWSGGTVTAVLDTRTGRSIPLPTGANVIGLLSGGRIVLSRGPAISILTARTGAEQPSTDPCAALATNGRADGEFWTMRGADIYYGDGRGVDLAAGPVCSVGPLSATGTATLTGDGVTGPAAVELGGRHPLAHSGGGDYPVLLAVPGAVLVYEDGLPAAGDEPTADRLVALR